MENNNNYMNSQTIQTDIQMRFADVDSLRHVNNVNLQHYFDMGKNDYFERVLGLHTIWDKEGIINASTNTSYFAQSRLGERLFVETCVEKVGNKSITFFQRLISRDTDQVKAESHSVMVAFDFERQVSIPVPDRWRKIMEGK